MGVVCRSKKDAKKKNHPEEGKVILSSNMSVASKSLLSGYFPNSDSSFSALNDSEKHAGGVPSMVISSRGNNPPLMSQISSLSIDGTEDEGLADVELLVDHATELWKTDGSSVIKNTSRPNDKEECQRVFDDMILDRAQLHRILVARNYLLEAATDLFFEQVRFRARWKPKEIQPSDIPNALPSGAWRLCGYTLEGCIVSNYKLKHWDPNTYGSKQNTASTNNAKSAFAEGVDEYVRYVVFMLELMIQHMQRPPTPQKFCLIFDLKGFSPSLVFRKNVRAMIVKLIYVAQAQYPERLQKVLLVNAPMGFESAWKLIKPMLDEKTASKVGFCSKLSDLLEDIDSAVLAKEYGGTHDEYPLPNCSRV